MLAAAIGNRQLQQELWIACSREFLFWLNAFAFIHEPRLSEKGLARLPFITWEYQDECLTKMEEYFGNKDLFIEKSRDMGATWMALVLFTYKFIFAEGAAMFVASRKADLIWKKDDQSCLLWKVIFLLKNLPLWMQPEYIFSETDMSISNRSKENTIIGDATTGDISRGGRCTCIFFDEFASVPNGMQVLASIHDVSNSVFYASTPKGSKNAFATIRNTGIEKLRLHWSRHPTKSKGLYRANNGKLEVLDKTFRFPETYPFVWDGKLRSPWYDNECRRRPHQILIAQELDIDYVGSAALLFDEAHIRRVKERDAKIPDFVGELQYDMFACVVVANNGYIKNEAGRWKLWYPLDPVGRPIPLAEKRFVVSADISQGTGASNSILCVSDVDASCKVAEFASPTIKPETFGRMAVAVARLWGNALLIWEANGPGRTFGREVLEAEYGNIWYRRDERQIGAVTKIPGWWSSDDERLQLLSEYRAALEQDLYLERSVAALDETLEYVFNDRGTVEFKKDCSGLEDPSGARSSHADRVIASALGAKCCRKANRLKLSPLTEDRPAVVPPNCFFARREEKKRESKGLGEGW